jgi:hypothetical protein
VEGADPGISDQIDAAYHAKHRCYPQYVAPMITPEAMIYASEKTKRLGFQRGWRVNRAWGSGS